ncbi:MAG: YafY family protein [Clostridium sp.]|nr:YafY family protein [Clostridium sp.]
MKVERLLGLICTLVNTDKKITIQQLANHFEVSKRTIFRDLDTLNRAGIPIVSYPGIGGGIAILQNYKIDKNLLSTSDTEKLFTALRGLKSINGDTSITNLIAKLVPEKCVDVFSKSDYVIDLSSWFNDSIIYDKISKLHHAICDCYYISIEYISRNSHSMRTVEPHKLIFKQSNWYLYAFCQKQNDFRLFKISRIVSYKILTKHFKRRPVDTIKFDNNYGVELFSPQNEAKLFEVVLEYDVADEFDLTNKIDASFFRRNINVKSNCGQIRFQVSNLTWTTDLIFSILNKVRVISPDELKQEIKHRLNKINFYYKDDI